MDDQLRSILSDSWNTLAGRAVKTVTVCNLAGNEVNAYTVVLREASADDYTLLFFTDYRSPKVAQIAQSNYLTVLTYLEDEKLQLILKGRATTHYQNRIAQLYWKEEGYRGRRSYLAQPAPSTVVSGPSDGLSYLEGQKFEDKDNTGYENFAVIEIQIDYTEYLQLNHDGNRRAKFRLNEATEWDGMWLIP
jgi:pyridoxamine 5'-phosphate oxidase